MPRKTDSNNPADWLFIAASDPEGIRTCTEREVAYAMCRSKLAEVLEKVLKNLSERGGEMLKEEMEMLGPLRKALVEDAQEKILNTFSKLEKDGVLTVNRGEE